MVFFTFPFSSPPFLFFTSPPSPLALMDVHEILQLAVWVDDTAEVKAILKANPDLDVFLEDPPLFRNHVPQLS